MFSFKQFVIKQDKCAMKVGTDGVLLGAWADVPIMFDENTSSSFNTIHPSPRILDIGTGTGLVALMLAQRFPTAIVDAVEIDSSAAEQAKKNVECSPFASRVNVFESSIQQFAESATARYDAIVSNPPFFENALKNPDSQKAQARHTDSLSYRELLCVANKLLKEGGAISVILPTGNTLTRFIEEACYQGFLVSRQTLIRTTEKKSPKRCLVELKKCRKDDVKKEEVILMNSDNTRSEWYQNLTKDFYL